MKRMLLLLAALLGMVELSAYDFEQAVPANVKVRGRGSVALDTDRFKDGASSLRFSWTGQAELQVVDPDAIRAMMESRKGGLMFWICNESPLQEPLHVSLRGADGRDICGFDFGMDFTGWRAGWIRYEDMRTSDGWVGDVPVKERRTDGVLLALRPSAKVAGGSFCLDRLRITADPVHHQNCPDAQIPENNHFLARRTLWHWGRLWEWEQLPPLAPAPSVDAASLSALEQHLEDYYLDEMPSGRDYRPAAYRPTLRKALDALHLVRLPDGTVKGTPVVSNDESTASDVKMQKAFDLMYRSALDYRLTGDARALEDFFLVADHLLWQGLDWGSGMGTNHHYGYNIRGWCNALWLLRREVTEAGKMPAYRRALEYWSGISECRAPYEWDRDENIDSWNTLLLPKLTVCLLQDTPEMQQACLQALTDWLDASFRFTPGTLGGFKADGTAFHHGGHYPAYAIGAFSTLGTYFRLVDGTSFIPSAEARFCVKTCLMALRTYSNRYDWGLGISGRHPFGGHIPAKVREAYGALAVLGDLTGSGKECDPDLGGAFFALNGKDRLVAGRLKKDGIKAADAPEGFFTYNYGAFGIHRRNGWMVTLKAYNTDVWGSEIYARDNRYGRYQSYGSVQVIHGGKPASAAASRFFEDGWDWNRMPGTTTIHLPWAQLDSPLKGTLMERNTSRFPGVSSLEGRNGVLAFTVTEKDRPGFCAGATSTQSVFCFDNRIVFIGTGITNSSDRPTETTLFQQHLESQGEAVLVDGQLVNGFPQTWRGTPGRPALVEDLSGCCYIVPDAGNLVLFRQHQQSPDNTGKKVGEGDFVTAVLDHGVAPREASYEYLMLVEPTASERNQALRKKPYDVLQADNDAHVVRDRRTGITAYVSYAGCRTEAVEIPAETIVMERTGADGRIMSVCTPDLGLTEKTYTTPQESQPLERIVSLAGTWHLARPYEDPAFGTAVRVETGEGSTRVHVTCRNGHPVEFILQQR